MIKANELRIGNLFYPIDRSKDVHMVVQTPFILMSVSQINVRGFLFGQEIHTVIKYDEFSIRDIEPITLTPEILEKCGFIEDNLSYYKGCIELYYQRSYKGYFFKYGYILNSSEAVAINTLHQLQNLIFALTGEELEIAF